MECSGGVGVVVDELDRKGTAMGFWECERVGGGARPSAPPNLPLFLEQDMK